MPLYSRLPRKVALIVEAAVPALLIFAIVGIGYVKSDSNARASREAKQRNEQLAEVTERSDAALAKLTHDNAVNACNTTHASDVSLHDFLVKSIGTGARAHDPRSQKFLNDLAFAQNVTYGQCLMKARSTVKVPVPAP